MDSNESATEDHHVYTRSCAILFMSCPSDSLFTPVADRVIVARREDELTNAYPLPCRSLLSAIAMSRLDPEQSASFCRHGAPARRECCSSSREELCETKLCDLCWTDE